MTETGEMTIPSIVGRLLVAAIIGALIGYERRLHNKTIGITGMMLVAVGSAGYMILASHLAASDEQAVSRAIQGVLQGIGFLGGAAIFKGGTDVRGIKTAAAVWITGAAGLAIGTWFWKLGLLIGTMTVAILFVNDIVAKSHAPAEEPHTHESKTGRPQRSSSGKEEGRHTRRAIALRPARRSRVERTSGTPRAARSSD